MTMIRRIICSFLLLACAVASGAGLSPTPASSSSSNRSASEPKAYYLRAMDTISIVVWDHPEFSVEETQIRPDGRVTHPFIGDLLAAGKRPDQLADEVRRKLATELHNPIVRVLVIDFMTNQFFVIGGVNTPGTYRAPEPPSAGQAIAMAGGVTPRADLARAVVVDANGNRREVDVRLELQTGTGVEKVFLQPGDTLIIPEYLTQRISVQGAVAKPGMIDIPPEGLLLGDAIAMAGGFLPEAAPDKTRLSRKGLDAVTVDMAVISHNAQHPSNASLRDGDAIFVPLSIPHTIAVLGEVKEPGVKTLPRDGVHHVSDAVALAAGLLDSADREISLMRADGTTLSLDLPAILAGTAPQLDIALQPGDSLFVPRLADYFVLGAVANPGRFPLISGTRVSDALAAAGLTQNGGQTTAVLMHVDGTSQTVDLAGVLSDKGAVGNVQLRKDDTLVVSTIQGLATILGPVAAPGPYALTAAPRLADLVAVSNPLPQAGADAILYRADAPPLPLRINDPAQLSLPLVDRDIVVVADASIDVSVLGAVKAPGRYQLQSGSRFSEALAVAGDMAEFANAVEAKLVRRDGSTLTIDPAAALAGTAQGSNPLLQDGDSVIVQRALLVNVIGDVQAPQRLVWVQGMTVLDAIAETGGLRETADKRRAALIRQDAQMLSVDLARILSGTHSDANLQLEGGDTLLIASHTQVHATILGAVAVPGRYPLGRSQRFSELLAQAGGLAGDTIATHATLMHQDGQALTVDVQAAMEGPGTQQDPLIQDGDIVVLQRVDPITVLGQVKIPGTLSVLPGTAGATVIAMSGGYLDSAAPERAELIRKDGSRRPVDLTRGLSAEEGQDYVGLQPGDILIIPQAEFITAVGGVAIPGRVRFTRGMRISSLLAEVRGLTGAADRSKAFLTRQDGTRIPVDIQKVLATGDPAEDRELEPGDLLIVPETDYRIGILGAVERPGHYPLRNGTCRLSTAIAVASGFREDADPARVKIIRDGEQVVYDLSSLTKGDVLPDDPLLQDGDLVVVPESTHLVTILGVVPRPGVYPFDPGDTVLDVVARSAGGWIDGKAAPNRTILARRVQDRVGVADADLLAAAKSADFRHNPTLEDGDIIYVPPVSQTTPKGILEVLFPVASVFRLFGLD